MYISVFIQGEFNKVKFGFISCTVNLFCSVRACFKVGFYYFINDIRWNVIKKQRFGSWSIVTLNKVNAHSYYGFHFSRGFYAFSKWHKLICVTKVNNWSKKLLFFQVIMNIADKRTVNFDIIRGICKQIWTVWITCAVIINGKLGTAEFASFLQCLNTAFSWFWLLGNFNNNLFKKFSVCKE